MFDILLLGGNKMFEGKPRKRADGRWEIQITVGTDQSGKRIRRSFYGDKQKEVLEKKDQWIKDHQNEINRTEMKSTSILFEEWADYWLDYKKQTVRPYTYKNTYYTRVEKYLRPYFKGRFMDAIVQMDIQKFFDKHQQLSLALLQTLKTILSNMFTIAMINDVCQKNPVVNIKLKSIQIKKGKKYLNKTQQQKAIKTGNMMS